MTHLLTIDLTYRVALTVERGADGREVVLVDDDPPATAAHAAAVNPPRVDPPPPPPASCIVCFDDFPALLAHRLETCGHAMCYECLRGYVAGKARERSWPVLCPVVECREPLTPGELHGVLTPEEAAGMAAAEAEAVIGPGARFYCPNRACNALLVADDKRPDAPIDCPHCHERLCANCCVAWHEGMSCRQYQSRPEALGSAEDRALLDLAESSRMKRCPGCGAMVERTMGCSHMRCRCGTCFCYSCGVIKRKGSSHFCKCLPQAQQWALAPLAQPRPAQPRPAPPPRPAAAAPRPAAAAAAAAARGGAAAAAAAARGGLPRRNARKQADPRRGRGAQVGRVAKRVAKPKGGAA